MKVKQLGEFIKEQREQSRLTLRNLSEKAGVSFPYLSQIERGLRKPSAEMLQAIAKGLRISAETLYVQAGILDKETKSDLRTQIMSDSSITERQRQMLLEIYEGFRAETARERRKARRSTDKVTKVRKAQGQM
jgi:transcriptional regulator with XRE-family HTH domain